MHHNQKRETRYEPRYEQDQRAQRQMYERSRDISPQRQQFDRAMDPRANPHSEPERYQEKKFDSRYDDRYHRLPGERREGQQRLQEHWQPAYAPHQERQHKGYLVMIRFHPSDISEVITAVQQSVSTLSKHSGYCIGFSEPSLMKIVIPSHQMLADDQWWDSRNAPKYSVACFWFQDYFKARSWFHTGHLRLKQHDFPNGNAYQVIAVPLTYGSMRDSPPFSPDRDQITLLWTEYPNIYERYEYDFRGNYSDRVREIVRYYDGNPYVSLCRFRAGQPEELNKFGSPGYARFELPERDKERVGRSWKNAWVKSDTFIAVSTFPYMDNVRQIFEDREFVDLRHRLSNYTEPVVVAITLKKVQGTTRA